MKDIRIALRGAALLGTLCALAIPSHAQFNYTVTDLGKVTNTPVVSRMNNKGEAAGYFNGTIRAMLYLPKPAYGLPAGFNDISNLAGSSSVLYDINDSGVGVGIAQGKYFRFERGQIRFLNIPGGSSQCEINEQGHIAGQNTQTNRGFVLRGNRYKEIVPPGGGSSAAWAINERGHVAVNFSKPDGSLRAGIYNYETDTLTELPSLPEYDRYLPLDINNSCDVVGYGAQTGVWQGHAMLWPGGTLYKPSGTIYDLSKFSGEPNGVISSANSITDLGTVLLHTRPPDSTVLWRAGQYKYIPHLFPPELGWSSVIGHDINDNEHLVGVGRLNGEDHVFLARSMAASLSGQLLLSEITTYANSQLLTFTFRPTDDSPVFHRVLPVPPTGEFAMEGIPNQAYTLHIQGKPWRGKNILVDATNGPITGLKATLFAGDANGDNAINIYDLAILAEAYESEEGDAYYNPCADFDGSHAVNFVDLTILALSFNTEGDE